MVPFMLRASINWNNLKQANSDNYSLSVTDGAKVIVCRMKNNSWDILVLHIPLMN